MSAAGGVAGGLFSMVGALAKYKVSQSLAKDQKKRADELRNESNQVKAPALRQEYKDVLRMKNLGAMQGLPGYEQYRDEIAQDSATQLQAGKGASSGADYLQYASSVFNNANKAQRGLKQEDSSYRAGALQDYSQTLWNTGAEQVRNEDIKRGEQQQLLGRSASLEDASTANEYQGKSDAIGGLVAAGASMAGGAMGAAGGKTGGGGNAGAGANVTPLAMAQPTQAAAPTPAAQQSVQFDSRSMMKYGLTMADMDALKSLQAKYPNATMDQLAELYKQNKQVH